ncbi:MAG: hypothetical protein KIT83_19765 [Bryobacterales bacterium]|nr:hypothetical protein [Bryobacterales bacterium]
MSDSISTETLSKLADVLIACPLDAALRPELRETLSARLAALDLDDLVLYPQSLTQDPRNHARYYLAADFTDEARWPSRFDRGVLLALIADDPKAIPEFPNFDVNERFEIEASPWTLFLLPFRSFDHDNLAFFVRNLAPEFLPRPQGAAPAIACGNRHPEISLPAAFAAFQSILGRTGRNVASTVQLSATREMTTDDVIEARDGEEPTAIGHTRVSIKHLFHTGLWAAIRAGFRDGYNAEADHFIISGHSEAEIQVALERSDRAIADAAGYTKFTTDTSRMFDLQADERHPHPYTDDEVAARFEQLFDDEQRAWIYRSFAQRFDVEGFGDEFRPRGDSPLAVKLRPQYSVKRTTLRPDSSR